MQNPIVERLREFYEAYRQALFTYALALTGCRCAAEDAIQNAFCNLLRRGKAPKELRPYVFRCVRNAAVDLLRSTRREAATDSIFEILNGRNAPIPLPVQHEIEHLMQLLSEEERETILLKVYSGMTFKEIATVRGVSINTAASWYRRGIRKLQDTIRENP
jgi:RNA polymerase sigma-70 factor (ECF subfamily)